MDFFRNKILPLLRGRYALVAGQDALSRDLVWLSLALILISWVLTLCRVPVAPNIFYVLALAALIFSAWRLFSRNIGRRQTENQRYLYHRTRFTRVFTEAWERFRNRKVYKYVNCPQCRKRLRLPRGKGAITVTCPECGKRFDAKT